MTTPCKKTLIQTPWHMDDYLCRAGWHLLRRKRWTVTTADDGECVLLYFPEWKLEQHAFFIFAVWQFGAAEGWHL